MVEANGRRKRAPRRSGDRTPLFVTAAVVVVGLLIVVLYPRANESPRPRTSPQVPSAGEVTPQPTSALVLTAEKAPEATAETELRETAPIESVAPPATAPIADSIDENEWPYKVTFYDTGEEAFGPFPSWKNVVKDFGAKGDGKADDTAAINSGLDALKNRQADGFCVLYFPAGTYRITGTLRNTGRVHGDDFSGMTIIGEDPARTTIVFDGASGDVMELDGWEIKVARLTLDGKSKAGNGVYRNGGFSTYSEFSDLFIKNMKGQGIQLAGSSGQGQAEVAIRRCRFTNIEGIAVYGPNYNTMDEYIWDSLFEDCATAISTGGWHAVGNVFLRSKKVDMADTWYPPLVVNNISIDSAKFQATGGNVTAAMYIGNKVYNCRDLSGQLGSNNPPNSVYLDNTFACSAKLDIVGSTGSRVYVGNTFIRQDPMTIACTHVDIDNKIVDPASVPVPRTISLPGTPPHKQRAVFEVRKNTGDDAAELQKQIDAACTSQNAGTNPIIHIPKGVYSLNATIVVPANKDILIVGDAASEYGTVIRWSGAGTGPGMKFLGPSRVTMRDLMFSFVGSTADCLLVEDADQVGGRVYCEQVYVGGNQKTQEAKHCFYIDGVENSDVVMVDGGIVHVADGGAGVLVKGGPDRAAGGNRANGQAYILFGGWADTFNLFDVVDGGRLVALAARDETIYAKPQGSLVSLTPASSGMLTVGAMSWAVKPSLTTPIVKIDGAKGTFTFIANSALAGNDHKDPGSVFLQVTGNGKDTTVLCCANDIGYYKDVAAAWKDDSSPAANANVMACGFLQNVNKKVTPCEVDNELISSGLSQLRGLRIEVPVKKPAGVTDVKLLRVRAMLGTNTTGFLFRRGGSRSRSR